MSRRFVFSALVALLVLFGVAAVAVGYFAYGAGFAQGVSQGAAVVVPDGAPAVVPFYYGRPFYPGFGWGPFGFLSCLFPLFGILLFMSVLRVVFGHTWRRGGWGGPGRMGWSHEGGPSSRFEEWHRRAHGEAPAPDAPPQQPG